MRNQKDSRMNYSRSNIQLEIYVRHVAVESIQAASRIYANGYEIVVNVFAAWSFSNIKLNSNTTEGFDLVSNSSALNFCVNIFNIYSRIGTNTTSI